MIDIGEKNLGLTKNICSLCTIVMICCMAITMVHANSFGVLEGDDYSQGVSMGVYNEPFINYFFSSLDYSFKEYMRLKGSYFSTFLQALLSPINNFGFRQLRCVLAFNAMLFWVVLCYFVRSFFGGDKSLWSYMIFLMTVFVCFGYTLYTEAFFWYSGAISHSFPFSFMLIAVTCYLRTHLSQRNVVLAFVFGVFAAGGALNVVGILCYVGALILLNKFITRTAKKIDICIFISWILGAMVNALCPGNFVRHGEGGLHIILAIKWAFEMAFSRWHFLFFKTTFVLVLLVVIVYGFYNKNKVENSTLLVGILGLFTPVVASYPVALGHSWSGASNRVAFTIDVSIVLSFFIVCFYIGNKLKGFCVASSSENLKKRMESIIPLICWIYLVCIMCITPNNKFVEVHKMLIDGTYEDHYYDTKRFMSSFEEYENGSDIVIKRSDLPFPIEGCNNFWLSNDPEHYINMAVAEYYSLNSITVIED